MERLVREMVLFLGAVILSVASVCAAAAPAMLLFGDSLVDVGTNVHIKGVPNAANFPPYGETSFHKPTGRFSNGQIIPDYLAKFMGLPLLPPYLQPGANFSKGVNFASAGSGILNFTNNENNDIIPLSTQIQQARKLLLTWKGDPVKVSKSVFLLITGSNDLIGGYFLNQTAQDAYSPKQFAQLLSKNYKSSLQALYQAGARKIAFAGVGPLGCTPQLRLFASVVENQTGCYAKMNELSMDFNSELETLFRELTTELKDAKVVYIKPYDFFMDMIVSGSKYGYTVTENNCCGAGQYNAMFSCGQKIPPGAGVRPFLCHRPSKYLFWDFHPTQRGCWFISNQIWSGDASIIEPVNLQTLASL